MFNLAIIHMKKKLCAATFAALVCLVTPSQAWSAPKENAAQKLCFEKVEHKDVTRVTLVINGSKVSGTMVWQPYEKDGATGTLKGTITDGLIKAVYDYTIEGSRQTEEKQFKLTPEALLVGEGELLDPKNDGHLKIKDPSKLKFKEALKKVTCKD